MNYFSDHETEGLNLRLVEMLNLVRARAGIPVVITSGLRSPSENASLPGSAPNSAHLTGLAVDIHCPDSEARYKLLEAALSVGFTRIGIETKHIHLDIDSSKPQNVAFLGVSA